MEKKNEINDSLIYMGDTFSKKKKIICAIIGILFVVAVAITSILVYRKYDNDRIARISNNKEKWSNEAIIEPAAGSLKAAGEVNIQWKSADYLEEVKEYNIYIDDKKKDTVAGDTLSYNYYTTEVRAHQLYIEAVLSGGSKIYSDVTTFYVNKKGLCVNKDMAQNIEADKWGVSWYYDWTVEALRYTSFQDLEFVPMVWKSQETDQRTISRFSKFGYKNVLAFNEPDLTEQSNIEVEDAVEGMKAFMNQNIRVGSPATALLPPWSKNWFQPFMDRMKYQNLDVDFIAVHHYWNWFTEEGAEAFLDLIRQTYDMYHKPIWITEFAISGNPGKNKYQRQFVIDYMKMVIPKLDKMDYVERYAWFSFSPGDWKNGASSLIQFYEGTITDLGHLYQDIGMPDGYGDSNIVNKKENPKRDVIE